MKDMLKAVCKRGCQLSDAESDYLCKELQARRNAGSDIAASALLDKWLRKQQASAAARAAQQQLRVAPAEPSSQPRAQTPLAAARAEGSADAPPASPSRHVTVERPARALPADEAGPVVEAEASARVTEAHTAAPAAAEVPEPASAGRGGTGDAAASAAEEPVHYQDALKQHLRARRAAINRGDEYHTHTIFDSQIGD